MGISYRLTDTLAASYMHTEKKYSIEYYAHQTTEVGKIQHFDYKDKEDFLIFLMIKIIFLEYILSGKEYRQS